MKLDVHQHIWTKPLVRALEARKELPFVRREQGLTVLFLVGERPYVINLSSESPASRATLVERDGLDRALICLSSPLGIEALAREQSQPLIDAYHQGALSLDPGSFGVWGSIALDGANPEDVDRVIEAGCVGLSLPAGALASVDAIVRLRPVLARLEALDAPLLIHPGPGLDRRRGLAAGLAEPSLGDPLWWSALTRYVTDMHVAWLAFLSGGRSQHPELRVVFSMLAGLAPLHCERLSSRGGPAPVAQDPLLFYETSSYGLEAVRSLQELVGAEQLLYGSDRPVVDPGEQGMPASLDWDAISDGTRRAFATSQMAAVR